MQSQFLVLVVILQKVSGLYLRIQVIYPKAFNVFVTILKYELKYFYIISLYREFSLQILLTVLEFRLPHGVINQP